MSKRRQPVNVRVDNSPAAVRAVRKAKFDAMRRAVRNGDRRRLVITLSN